MSGNWHEIRNPIQDFIILNDLERSILDSRPMQRLRSIKQLSSGHLVYPGATHTRFEHSLGTMELASRVFDILCQKGAAQVRALMGWPTEIDVQRCRQILRLGALLHDVGHPPFSHSAEQLMPADRDGHEAYTEAIVSAELGDAIERSKLSPFSISIEEVLGVALGPKRKPTSDPTMLLMGEIVTGELGVDRIDYLLRDALHTGVTTGTFDHQRLLNTMTVVRHPSTGSPVLAVEAGGIHAAEGLIFARYFMFLQVYFHHVRAIYDIHLVDFLRKFLPGNAFPSDAAKYLELDDDVVSRALVEADRDHSCAGHDEASMMLHRGHYRRAYELFRRQLRSDPTLFADLSSEVKAKFGDDVRTHEPRKEAVSLKDGDLLIHDGDDLLDILQVSDLIPSLSDIWRGRGYARSHMKEDVKRFCEAFITEKGGDTDERV